MLLALSLLWGGSFFFAEIALFDLSPLPVVFARVALAALVLLPAVLLCGYRLPAEPRVLGLFALLGLFNNAVPFLLIVSAQTRITGSLAAILNATTPFWSVLLARFLARDERAGPRRLFGVATGFAGVVLVVGGDVGGAQPVAAGAVLLATLSYALAALLGRRLAGIPAPVIATGQLVCATLWLLPVVAATVPPDAWLRPGAATLAALAGLALPCTALAYLLYFRILAAAGATNLLLVTLLIPPAAILPGVLLLDEHLAASHLAGMAVIATGLAILDGRLPALAGRRLAAFRRALR